MSKNTVICDNHSHIWFKNITHLKISNLSIHGHVELSENGSLPWLTFNVHTVWANKSILFPTTETLHPAQQILHIFIAWLNLDLGVETCFSDELDAYRKTWLQFVFPLYVWSITGVVIIASHYSTRASKIFGILET